MHLKILAPLLTAGVAFLCSVAAHAAPAGDLRQHYAAALADTAAVSYAEIAREAFRQGSGHTSALAEAMEDVYLSAQSPMRDEARFTAAAQAFADIVSDDSAMRVQYLLDNCRKNAPGSFAADFSYIDNNSGNTATLSSLRGTSVVLFFYDPGCDLCHVAADLLTDNNSITDSLARGTLSIIALAPDAADGDGGCEALPSSWVCASESDGCISGGELYAIDTYPTLYLIAPDGRVQIKAGTVQEIISCLDADRE